jgi:Skp family chaperone for outer membrane proteins
MKSRTMILAAVVGVIALLATFEYTGAAQPRSTTSKIGVVSIRTAFNKTRQQMQYQSQAMQKYSRKRAELESLAKEIEAAEAELKTHKPGTADYLQRMQPIIEKKAQLEAQQEYVNQQRMLDNKLWMEKLYQETLKIVGKLAQEKGLDLVLERTEPDFPISSDELMATFSTHKVLYAAGAVDLTDEVVSRLDASDNLQP